MDDIQSLYNLANVYSDIARARPASPVQMSAYNNAQTDMKRDADQALLDQDYEQTVAKVKQMRIDSALRNAYAGVKANQDATAYQDQVAQAKQKAARDILAIDPVTGIKLADDAAKTTGDVLKTAAQDAQTKQLQFERAATLMGSVGSQQDWDETQLQLAKMGMPVPPRYKVFNEGTQQWIQNRIAFSDSYAQLANVNYQASSAKLRQQELDLSKKKQDFYEKNENAKEQRLRNNVDVPNMKELDYNIDMQYLDDNEKFSDLPSDKKLGIIQRINSQAAYLQKNGYSNPAEAKEAATQYILNNVDEEGNFIASRRPTAPAVGTIKNGYKFLGGNPADQASWEKQ
jgi:hypothetical protein